MTDDRSTRMAWSTVAAVAMHAAAFVSWPSFPVYTTLAPIDPSATESTPAEWIFMDQVPEGGGEEGDGPARARPGSGDVTTVPQGNDPRGIEPAPRGLSEALRDRLVRATSLTPTLAESEGAGGGLASPSSLSEGPGIAVGSSGMPGLSASDEASLEQLSALDLERLSAIRPDVALEAISNWVLVRNPDQVRDFILRHPTGAAASAGGRRAVSVAIWVSSAGTVEWAEVVASSGRSEWDQLALELFNDVVTFRPARLEGIPMPMSAIFTVDFPW